jgi:pimeloyl-ACP methyl ester carboxylesterase
VDDGGITRKFYRGGNLRRQTRFMAERADAKKVVVVKGASHVVMISHPDAVAQIIHEAATTAVK